MARRSSSAPRSFGETEYREGAFDRLVDASHLLRTGSFAGAIYLAGRGVEGMLRAVIWRQDSEIRTGRKSLETGHDLLDLLEQIARLGLLRREHRDAPFRDSVEYVARLWFNNMRFASNKKVRRIWGQIGEINNHRSIKMASKEYYDACVFVVKRCEALL